MSSSAQSPQAEQQSSSQPASDSTSSGPEPVIRAVTEFDSRATPPVLDLGPSQAGYETADQLWEEVKRLFQTWVKTQRGAPEAILKVKIDLLYPVIQYFGGPDPVDEPDLTTKDGSRSTVAPHFTDSIQDKGIPSSHSLSPKHTGNTSSAGHSALSKAKSNNPPSPGDTSPEPDSEDTDSLEKPGLPAPSPLPSPSPSEASSPPENVRKHARILKKDIRRYLSRDRITFEESIQALGMESITLGGESIAWSDIAQQTIDKLKKQSSRNHGGPVEDEPDSGNDHPEEPDPEQQAHRETEEQLDACMDKWRRANPNKPVPEDDAWQIIFNLIAYVFYPAQEQAIEIAKALYNPKKGTFSAVAYPEPRRLGQPDYSTRNHDNITADIDQYIREKGASGTAQSTEADIVKQRDEVRGDITEQERRLKSIANIFMSATGARLSASLVQFYKHCDQVQLAHDYSDLLDTWNQKRHIFRLLFKSLGLEELKVGQGAATGVLRYICHETYGPTDDVEEKKKRKEIARGITDTIPAASLRGALGDGVLVLLGKNRRDLINGVSSDGSSYKSTGDAGEACAGEDTDEDGLCHRRENQRGAKMRIVALCLKTVDEAHGGRIVAMLEDARKYLFEPAVQLRKGPMPNGKSATLRRGALDQLDRAAKLDDIFSKVKNALTASAATARSGGGQVNHKRRRQEPDDSQDESLRHEDEEVIDHGGGQTGGRDTRSARAKRLRGQNKGGQNKGGDQGLNTEGSRANLAWMTFLGSQVGDESGDD